MDITKLEKQIENAEAIIKKKQKLIRDANTKIKVIERDVKFKEMEIEIEKLKENQKSGGIFG
jgi:predicted  nucleic acid-binding Zn-ribbon protein